MSAIVKVLVPQSRLDIFSCNRKTEIDIKAWVANQHYLLDDDLDSRTFALRVTDITYLIAAFANDCNRMAMATIESTVGLQIDPKMEKSGAWGIIRAYYAAFFAAHSIVRMFGISCSQLEQAHTNKIYEIATLLGRTNNLNKLEKGFYSIRMSTDSTNIYFEKFNDSHRDTWAIFLSLLDILKINSEHIETLSKYKIEAIDILTKIKQGITRSHCSHKGNWLSKVRNSVNYQHSHGVWFPYERKVVAPLYLDKMAKEWLKSSEILKSTLRNGEIEIFFEVVLMILSLFRELLLGCTEKVNQRKSVFTNGCLKLFKTLQAT
jgi:uncharacterized protein (UPF0332 family)